MKYAIFEILEQIGKEWGPKKKLTKWKEFDSQYLKILADVTFNPNFKWLVPEGAPEYKEADDDYATLKSKFYSELLKIGTYLNVGPYPNLHQIKRENLFRTTLETIHPMDAKLLLHIKDKRQLPYNIPQKVVEEAYPAMASKWVVK